MKNSFGSYCNSSRGVQAVTLILCLTSSILTCNALSSPCNRVDFMRSCFIGGAGLCTSIFTRPDNAIAATKSAILPKTENLSDDEIKRIIKSDVVDKQFLVSADLTREIYDESSMFTDEIDTYTLPKWIKGTKALFRTEGSHIDLIDDIVVSSTEVTFRFDEDLMFNIPFRPVVHLSGKVVLTRDPNNGLITSYREFWDQDVNTVLKTAKFNL